MSTIKRERPLVVKKPAMKKPKKGTKPKKIGEGMDNPGGPKTPGAKGTFK